MHNPTHLHPSRSHLPTVPPPPHRSTTSPPSSPHNHKLRPHPPFPVLPLLSMSFLSSPCPSSPLHVLPLLSMSFLSFPCPSSPFRVFPLLSVSFLSFPVLPLLSLSSRPLRITSLPSASQPLGPKHSRPTPQTVDPCLSSVAPSPAPWSSVPQAHAHAVFPHTASPIPALSSSPSSAPTPSPSPSYPSSRSPLLPVPPPTQFSPSQSKHFPHRSSSPQNSSHLTVSHMAHYEPPTLQTLTIISTRLVTPTIELCKV
ncbi:hypothetical protein K469DRAFT_147693 [Zopfia rhizophila CBS 207.26]|uniref:Uncharacterized protein n=1 Tax=Zopfia rhizophila CBS 207.26 TaxID=1314779 RepID=A0A6A6E7S1_9PEZI|nr:hypothetical protein K469DRAFT_147693 [Zopfia rhizophila CBS 207.26]